jgi:hypothetical protein
MNFSKRTVIGTGAAIALFCAARFSHIEAQNQAPVASSKTNIVWLGTAVAGVNAPGVVGGPFPRAEKEIEIGLRADGVVVWRKASIPLPKK